MLPDAIFRYTCLVLTALNVVASIVVLAVVMPNKAFLEGEARKSHVMVASANEQITNGTRLASEASTRSDQGYDLLGWRVEEGSTNSLILSDPRKVSSAAMRVVLPALSDLHETPQGGEDDDTGGSTAEVSPFVFFRGTNGKEFGVGAAVTEGSAFPGGSSIVAAFGGEASKPSLARPLRAVSQRAPTHERHVW
jgi:hypothetical protein